MYSIGIKGSEVTRIFRTVGYVIGQESQESAREQKLNIGMAVAPMNLGNSDACTNAKLLLSVQSFFYLFFGSLSVLE